MRPYFPNLSPVRGFRHLAAGIAVFAVASGPAFADLIVLRDGHEYEGTLVRATKDSVVFRRGDRTVTYPRSEVVHIRLQKKRKWAGARRAADIPDEEFQTALAENERIDPRKWPGAGVVTLLRKLTVEVRTPQTWVLRSRRIVRILNEHGESASVQQMVYRGDVDRVRILYGITVRPDGAVLHLADTAVQDESVYPEYPRYDTVRRRRFALPEGKPGNVLASEVEIERVRPMKLMYFAREFLFGGRDPVVRAEVEVSAPPDVPFHWAVLNDPEGTVRHTVERRKGRVVHRWVRLHSPQMLPEPLMPPWSDVVPRLVTSAGTTSWAEAAARFRAELQRLDQTYTSVPALPGDDVRSVWEAVSRAVKTAPVSLLASGRVPRDPNETWRLRSGAPIDRCYLLYRRLQQIAGGKGRVTWLWVRGRGAGRPAEEVPGLAFLGAPAIRLEIPGQPVRVIRPGDDLDAFGEPGFFLGGAFALDERGRCSRLPVQPPERFGVDRRVEVTLSRSGTGAVVDRITWRGAEARRLRAWRRLTREEVRNQVQARVRAVDGQARRIRWSVEGDVTKNQPEITLILRYEIPAFADVRRTLCSLQPPWLEYDAGVVGRDTRRFPLFWAVPRQDSVSVTIHGPKGYAVYAVPRGFEVTDGPAAFSVRMQTRGASATCETVYRRSVLDAPASAYAALKRCLERRAALGRQYWVWRPARKGVVAGKK